MSAPRMPIRARFARPLYRRSSLPFRLAFQAVEAVRRGKLSTYKGNGLASSYVSGHTQFTLNARGVFAYQRVYSILSNFNFDTAPEALRVLSIGPRTEIELYYLWLLGGFAWENIEGVDLVSWSSKIKLADMSLELPFDDNVFDVIVASHCLEKSGNPEKTRNEIRRVVKSGGRVLVAGSPRRAGDPLHEQVPYEARYFKEGLHGFIDLYGLSLPDIEYMNAHSPHGWEIIFRVKK